MYIPLCAVFPGLKALQYWDSNTPCMDKIYYLSHRTTVAIEKLQDDLNDESLFGSLNTDRNLLDKGNIALGSNLNNSANIGEDKIVFMRLLLLIMVLMMKAVMMNQRYQVIQPCHLHVR
jgi:hypothetical protein